MGNYLSKRKNMHLVGIILLLTAGFMTGQLIDKTNQTDKDGLKVFSSNVLQEDCMICKNMQLHVEEDNLGILLLNEGVVEYVRINRYDEYGKIIKKSEPAMQIMTAAPNGEDMEISVTIDTNRGYARVKISLGTGRELNLDKVTQTCCNDCSKQILEEYEAEKSFGVGIINFKTGKIKLLDSDMIAYMSEDFYISFEAYKGKGEKEVTDINLLMFYCPERYE